MDARGNGGGRGKGGVPRLALQKCRENAEMPSQGRFRGGQAAGRRPGDVLMAGGLPGWCAGDGFVAGSYRGRASRVGLNRARLRFMGICFRPTTRVPSLLKTSFRLGRRDCRGKRSPELHRKVSAAKFHPVVSQVQSVG
jgi:hypothetical protein